MNSNPAQLRPEDRAVLDRCLAIIKAQPPTTPEFRDAVHLIADRKLWAGYANLNAMLCSNTKMGPEQVQRVIAACSPNPQPEPVAVDRSNDMAEPSPGPDAPIRSSHPPRRLIKAGPVNSAATEICESEAEPPLTPPRRLHRVAPTPPARLVRSEAEIPDPCDESCSTRSIEQAPESGDSASSGTPRRDDRPQEQKPVTWSPAGAQEPPTAKGTGVDDRRDPRACGSAEREKPGRGAVEMDLSAIKLDPGLQCRASVNQATVGAYAERMEAGDKFPPLDAFEIAEDCLLVDGWQRYFAAQQAGLTKFHVVVHHGTRQEALRFAIQSNNRHGHPLTNKDKRRVVQMVLQDSADLSDRAIANLCKVTHPMVMKVRRQLVTVTSCGKRVGRDGKARKVPKRPKRAKTGPEAEQPSQTRAAAGETKHKSREDTYPAKAPAQTKGASQHPSANESEFSYGDALARLEDFLFAELELWPQEKRWLLGGELRKFADINCI